MKTITFSVDAIGDPEPITVQTVCHQIVIFEDALASTTNYKVRKPSKTDAPVTKAAGTSTLFTAPPGSFFLPGQILGYVETPTGSMTMAQIEE